jgi:hypothetical protein
LSELPSWVREELGGTRLGDARRDARLLRLVAAAAKRPHGRVSEVFRKGAERQAAYDFLEHDAVDVVDVTRAAWSGTARQIRNHPEVLVPLDGSSLALTDNDRAKGFGSVGSRKSGATGLKVITALALTTQGRPLGILSQEWWARGKRAPKKSAVRPLEKRESHHWHQAVELAETVTEEQAPGTRLHFLVDREGDASLLMQRLLGAGHAFTIRANGTRNVIDRKGKRVNVRAMLEKKSPCLAYEIEVPAKAGRKARRAQLHVRFASVRLVMRDRHAHKRETMAVSVVWAREAGHHREPIDWMLYSTTPVTSGQDALATVQRYTYRWRVEEFHRTWKRGGCSVEETQLRSKNAVIKWATILAVVAARAERLKHASRATPDVPASEELSQHEIAALIDLKREQKARNEVVPDGMPTLGQAVRWIADLGGYIGPRNGPPGATVIARGLAELRPAAAILKRLHDSGRLR